MANIEKHLILSKYILSLFGVSEFKTLQSELVNTETEIDSEGKTHFYRRLSSFSGINKEKLPEDKLIEYDKNIIFYTNQISFRRDKVNLKYFQYLAVLFSEIIFDNLKNRKTEFLSELNDYLNQYNEQNGLDLIDKFTSKDLAKLAFWMATGSGKTLIMHINYYQFIKYKLFEPDNIILITPNEGLSKQHFDEMQKSGVPAKLYGGTLTGTLNEYEVLILEITKLVEEKKGGGVTLPVNVFEGKNLILVDEGHKGKTSEEQAWAKLRNKLAENGFVFEYSATFGQILSERNKDILREYAKSIIFDYSYKYFYLDNYGKDFSVVNMPANNVSENKFKEIMFVANLLSFYEQLLIYDDFNHKAREINLEKPLWIFVGTTVTAKNVQPDVLQIVELLHKIFTDESWLKEKIEKIINANSGLNDENGNDLFKNKFKYIRKNVSVNSILKKVSGGRGNFAIYEIKNAEGELGIKTGENDYFGVVNIGDISGFKKELEKLKIEVKQDSISTSLFENIKKEKSSINILIGAKKFIEGWDTWRVSSMGLLNIGKGEGPQIIQLFGRGIRIKGRNYSLKRSATEDTIKSLETLNIFGIKANYLDKFLDAISNEDVDYETIEIPVEEEHKENWKNLSTLGKDENKIFEEDVVLKINSEYPCVIIDLLPKITTRASQNRTSDGVTVTTTVSGTDGIVIPPDIINLLDWDLIMKELFEYKILKGYWNLILDKEYFQNYLLSENYKIKIEESEFNISSKAGLEKVQGIALTVLKCLIDKIFKTKARQYESENMKYKKLEEQLPLFVFERGGKRKSYTIQIEKSKERKIKEIKKLLNDLNKLLKEEDSILPRVYFDKHFFLPLLLQDNDIHSYSPPALENSEAKFIKYLRDYIKSNSDKFTDYEIFLLRNFPKSGTGFFNLNGFYPDFVMWIKGKDEQHIIYIDPKGLIYSKELDNEKIQLHNNIKEIEKRENKKNIHLHSFIISKTNYLDLIKGRTNPPAKDDYINNNVLFLEDSNWQELLFQKILQKNNFKTNS